MKPETVEDWRRVGRLAVWLGLLKAHSVETVWLRKATAPGHSVTLVSQLNLAQTGRGYQSTYIVLCTMYRWGLGVL